MTKKLDTDQITNELKGQSLYFENQSKRLAKKNAEDERPNERTDERSGERTREQANERTVEQPNGRTDELMNEQTDELVKTEIGEQRTKKRSITRHSYQFYADQVEAMKRLWLSYQARGLDIDLSDLAREAFDEYLKRFKENANDRANERTDERSNTRTGEREKA